ncbi:hypothetical protein AB0M02_35690 [Actinoplanes sp. NPDC051861]|uniref:hypothetical protein n=1 Tax=Actinoplanes sp. NPDC051861 TaxID=3155170 RepID=UPI0034403A16
MLNGLARNPALPRKLLLALIHLHGEAAADGLSRRRPLEEAALAAMLAHSDHRVRAAVAANTSVGTEVRLGLLRDPHRIVRNRVVQQRDLPIPESGLVVTLERLDWFRQRDLLTPQEELGEIQEEVWRDRRLLRVLARHPEERYRLMACTFGEQLEEAERDVLLGDPSAEVRAAIAERLAEDARPRTPAELDGERGWGRTAVLVRPLTAELLDRVLSSGDAEDLYRLTHNRHLPPAAVEALVNSPDPEVRRSAAGRADLTAAQAARLAADPDQSVRTAVSVHPALTERQRAAMVPALDDGLSLQPRRPAPGETSVWARSVNPILRRWAARDPDLGSADAERLAVDPDDRVRATLAEHHPAAPPELLLWAYLSKPGSRSRHRPGFPTEGLARHAGDENAQVRLLATLDPEAGPALLETLLTDSHADVRASAAAHPRLPVKRILALLDDPDLGGHAAANPALPVTEMESLINFGC